MKRLCLTIALMLWPLLATAQSYPDYTSTTVNDFAQLLPDTDKATLVAQLDALKRDTGVEMTLVTLPRQDDYAPNISMEDFATGLFNHWGIGDKTANNGILVLVLPNDRAMRIELGAGYDRSWDRTADHIINRSFLPAFKEGDYRRGIMIGMNDTIDTIGRSETNVAPPPGKKDGSNPAWMVVLFAVVGGFVVFSRRIKDMFARIRKCPSCHRRGGLRVLRHLSRKATRALGGLGQKRTTCGYCDYSDTADYTTRPTSASTKRGSFGGGRSRGGGGSGRW